MLLIQYIFITIPCQNCIKRLAIALDFLNFEAYEKDGTM
jgi:hypothetical protein